MEQDKELFKIRHSTAHLLAYAVKKLYPKVKIAIGPVIDNGFYYDFDFGTQTIGEKDLKNIEEQMQKIKKENIKFKQSWVTVEEAKKIFKEEPYKLEIIDEIKQGKRDDFGKKNQVSLYTVGEFIDLCKGPHVKELGKIGAFKLLKIAGAYWKGDEKNKMLTRIYGTAFKNKEDLKKYLELLEEAKRRDHKKLGKQLDLFTFSEKVGPGIPLWPPKGAMVRILLDNFVWDLRKQKGYKRVEIPHIKKKNLYKTSGHWKKFADELFKIKTREGKTFVLKPMNCPHHTQIFARKEHSYREMPQRYANTTMVYRDEQTGELSGLSRVISITQDDAHVFCRNNQVKQEIEIIWDIIQNFYKPFNLPIKVRLSFHDPKKPQEYLGDAYLWKKTEQEIRLIAKEKGIEYYEAPGEAAFYGPKLDFIATDSLGREWQVATIQLDRNMPNRFGLYCINEKGEKEEVVMLHAAIMGSIERFLGILIEHLEGNFPVWLSPIQVIVIPVSDKSLNYAKSIYKELIEKDFRIELDDKNETVSKKIKRAQEQKVPYMLIVGEKEEQEKTVSVRTRQGNQINNIRINEFINKITPLIDKKSMEL